MEDELEAARDASTPPLRLTAFAMSDDRRILEAVAGNPSTPLDALWPLAERCPAAVASNPLLPVLALGNPAALGSLPGPTARALLAEPAAPAWLRALAVQSPGLSVEDRFALVRAPETPDAVLLALASGDDATSRAALAGRPSLSVGVEAALVRDPCDDIRLRMALRPGLSAQARAALRGDTSAVVRLAASAPVEGATVAGAPLALPHGIATDLGQREHNEDAAAVVPLPGALLAVVADGMGGGDVGSVASTLAIERISRTLAGLLPRVPEVDRGLALLAALSEANLAICEASVARELRGMGTTAAVLLLDRRRAIIAHVGDSRVFRLRAGKLEALSRDRPLFVSCFSFDTSELDPLEQPQFSRVLGLDVRGFQPELREEELLPGDTFALCTDGAHGSASGAAIEEAMALALRDPELAAGALLAAGAPLEDNATAVVVAWPGPRGSWPVHAGEPTSQP